MKGPRTDKGAYLLLLKDIMLEGIEIDFVVVTRLRLLHLSSANLTAVTIASINIRVAMCLSTRVISAHLSRLPDLCYCCTVYILRHSHHHTQIMRLLTCSLLANVVLAGPFSERGLREFGDISR